MIERSVQLGRKNAVTFYRTSAVEYLLGGREGDTGVKLGFFVFSGSPVKFFRVPIYP